MIDINKLHRTWARQPNYNPENPAAGQCAITALLVQDYLGGEILNTIVNNEVSHYFNIVDDTVIDLTKEQFAANSHYSKAQPKTGIFGTTREYILSYPETVKRYNLLKSFYDTNF